jgi:trimeric autotransporter adhesin
LVLKWGRLLVVMVLGAVVFQPVSAGAAAPVTLSAFRISPSIVRGTMPATATVTLSGPAPAGGVTVHFTGFAPWVDMPAQLTVPATQSSASFKITQAPARRYQSADLTIEAWQNDIGQGLYAPLRVTTITPGVSTVGYVPGAPLHFRSGHPGSIRLTLFGASPSQPTVVTLTSDNSALSVPATVTVPPRATSVDVPATVAPLMLQTTGTVRASANGGQAEHIFLLRPPGNLDAVTPGGPYILNGTTATKTVSLSYAQPTDTTIQLTSSDPGVTVPATVTIPAGRTSATFDVAVGALAAPTEVKVTARLGNEYAFGHYDAGPNAPHVVVVGPAEGGLPVPVGTPLNGVVYLILPAPAEGATVTLTSDDPHVSLPATVQVPPGAKYVDFTGTTSGTLTSNVTVNITASWNGITVSTQLTMEPDGTT